MPEKLNGCGAKLVYLDLAECCFVDPMIVSPIITLQKKFEDQGVQFEIRISGNALVSFFREIDHIVRVRDITALSSYLPPVKTVLAN
jgi:hypothetical protein